MNSTPTTILLAVLTGVALELGIHALSGRREAWDSAEFWVIGLPVAGLVSAAIGWLSRGRDWVWTLLVAPGQVTTMMVRGGELGGLWPLTVVLSAILSAPFVAAAFIGSRFRSRADDPTPTR
jgi:hypothetical protein